VPASVAERVRSLRDRSSQNGFEDDWGTTNT
ncbi:YtxH domain-containing protein, partial [Streptomyces sp. SID7982]|nr:YtxH domain-containing protein [Streptomyces sp. SID7982]